MSAVNIPVTTGDPANLIQQQGTVFNLWVNWFTDDDYLVPVDLTGFTARFEIALDYEEPERIVWTSETGEITLPALDPLPPFDPIPGAIQILAPSDALMTLAPKRYKYTLTLKAGPVNSDAYEYPLLRGLFTLQPELGV